jgi:hypothetical protein
MSKRQILNEKLRHSLDSLLQVIPHMEERSLMNCLEYFLLECEKRNERLFSLDRIVDDFESDKSLQKSSKKFEGNRATPESKVKDRNFFFTLIELLSIPLKSAFFLDGHTMECSKHIVSRFGTNIIVDIANPEAHKMKGKFPNGWKPNLEKAMDYEFFQMLIDKNIKKKYGFIWLDYCGTPRAIFCRSIPLVFMADIITMEGYSMKVHTTSPRNKRDNDRNAVIILDANIRAEAAQNGFFVLRTRLLIPFMSGSVRNHVFIMRPYFERFPEMEKQGVFANMSNEEIYKMDERYTEIADNLFAEHYGKKSYIVDAVSSVSQDTQEYYTVGTSKTVHTHFCAAIESARRKKRSAFKLNTFKGPYPENHKICGFCK